MTTRLDRSNEHVNRKVIAKQNKSVENPWDAAIAEAQRRIADLKFSIRDFQKRKERGDRWLGYER